MKTKFIHVGKRTLSVVLSIMMIVSTMLIGTISSVSAANVTATVYIDCTNMPELGSSSNKPNIYAWYGDNSEMAGNWPGSKMTSVSATVFKYDLTFDTSTVDTEGHTVKVIFNNDSKQTENIELKNKAGSDWITNSKIFVVSKYLKDNKNYQGTWQNYKNTVTYGVGTGMDSFGSVTATDSSSNTVDSDDTVDYKTSVTFKATANTDYEFKGWYSTADCTGTAVSTNNEYTVSVAANTTLYAKFVKVNYVYVKNKKQWSSVYAYFWNDNGPVGGTHPGTKMTPVATNESIYKIAVPDGATNVQFNDGTANNKSADIALSLNLNKIYNNSSTYWFNFDTTAKYTINGPIVGTSYEDWEATSSVSNEFDVYGTHYLDVELTDTAKGYFRIKYNTNSFGPARENDTTTGDEDIWVNGNSTPATAYEAHPTYNGKAFKISETGIYRIYVRDAYDANNRPDVWVVKTGDVSVTDPTITFGVNGLNGQLTATSGGNSISSGDTVTSGSSVTFTASPTDSTYTVEGWYRNADCTPDSKISDAGTNTSYTILNVTSDTTVYVKFKSSSEPVGNAPVLHKYEPVDGNGSIVAAGNPDKLNAEMTYYSDSKYAYYYYQIENGGRYLYNITLNNTKYYKAVTTTYANSIGVSNWSSWSDIFATGDGYDNYYIIYTPTLADDKKISVVTTLPGSTPPAPETYKVTMTQGVSSKVNNAMGSSYLDGVTTNKSVDKSFDNLTVTFTTETKKVENTDTKSLNYTGYMYQVYGYSVLMTLQDDTKQVDAVVNPINDTNSARPISALANGVYQCDYTFPSNIKSAVVTPVFTVSDDYASYRNISFTALYLKVTPGDNVFSNTYEPHYYTWRAAATDTTTGEPFVVPKNGRNLEREPEGAYGGQIMLHTNDDMYIAYVQSDIYGILFDNGDKVQSFDFNEFIKLQKLGYNNITFEPKTGSGNTVSKGINDKISNGVNNFYQTYDNGPEVAIDEYVDTDFELDVDIEGYYIDVFGDRLKDTNDNEIKRATVLSSIDSSTTVTTSVELAKLFEIAGIAIDKQNEIFGARYGWYSTADLNYGMNYAVRNYFIDGNSKKIISQQISGFGTIEGAQSPEDPTKNNAAYMYAKDSENPLTYFYGESKDSFVTGTFETGYELISDTYKNLPYLVSYKNATTSRATTVDTDQSGYKRIDGKWYYMSSVPQITITAKVGKMNPEGTIDMTDDGKIIDYTGNLGGCSATVNLQPSATIDQGSSAVLRAYNAGGYVFAGFYEENGKFISTSNPYEKVFANHSNVYAVFKPIKSGTLTVTNNIYNSILLNPAPGGGSGSISVQLIVKHKNEEGGYTEETASGTNSASVAIKDGDIFQWKITGKATGADEFIAFRQLSTLADGKTSYYVALDDEDCLLSDKSTKTYTYTSYECEWDWFNQIGTTQEDLLFKTFDFYTDFQKVSSFATLNYKYVNRFNEVKIYTVKNVPLDYDRVQAGNYEPTNEMILRYAPPIDEVFKDCTWTLEDLTLLDRANSVATLTANQDKKQYITYIKNGSNPNPKPEKAYFNETIQLTAAEKDGVNTFSYWKRYLYDKSGNIKGEGEIFSYQRSISVRVTFNSYFEAVYGVAGEKYYTNLQDPVYTREKFTDTNGKTTDYVYADFLLQFDTSDPNKTFADIVKNSGGSVKFGIVLERNTEYSYDGNGTIIAPDTSSETYESDLKDTILSLGKDLSAGETNKGWNTGTTTTDPEYNYYYYLYDLTDKAGALSTLGRYDFYLQFNNNKSNRSRVYNAYTYIIYTDDKNNKQIVVSKPKVLSIYETGVKADGSTSSTTTTTD